MARRILFLGAALVAACSTAADLSGETANGGSSSGGQATGGETSDGSVGGTTAETPTTEPVTTSVGETTTDPGMSASGAESTGVVPDGCGPAVEPGPTIVPTTSGAVEGVALPGGGVAFRGIPYAEPPVGALRFAPPVPRACTAGITQAQEFGAICPQVEKDAQNQVIAMRGEEDCLTLNVWTPAADGAARPVLVYIHGGGNSVGAGSDELFDGAALANARDVVVVTLNYRLGALGFLTHAALASESPDGVSGNYAILDQALALRWVQDNVAAFGGDPQRVLLFGESAGAVNTCALLGAPAAAGLFQRAIVQSGSCRERPLAQYEGDVSGPFVDNTGCAGKPDVAQCLRGLDIATILTTQPDGYPNVAALSQGWGPHIDGVVLPKSTLEAMSDGTANPGPKIFGANAQETANAVPPMTVQQYETVVKGTFGPLADQVLAQYPVSDYGGDGDQAYVALTSDVKFVCNARRAARAAAGGMQGPVFRYHFAYDAYTAPMNTAKAAFHGLELIYIFANWTAVLPGDGFEYQPNADDVAMSEQLQAAWVRFAATGDPAGADLKWPQYVKEEDNAAVLDVPPGLVAGVRTKQCDFWDGLLP
jgi:para-nitrobenzyl esterase